jgi:hypothetical protein
MVCALINGECEAIQKQCAAGPCSISSLFHETLLEEVPAGLFVHILGSAVANGSNLQPLSSIKDAVLKTILLECPEAKGFEDPRPFVLEAWLLSLIDLMALHHVNNQAVIVMLNETFVAMVLLLLRKNLGRTLELRSNDSGLGLDGPTSLALMDFLVSYFSLGGEMLASLSLILSREIRLEDKDNSNDDARARGITIIVAVLLRGVQGGLPPWAVETIPQVFSALYGATGRNPQDFGAFLQLATNVRLSNNELLSGRFFGTMSEKTKQDFISRAMKECAQDDLASWRRFKVIVKQACGGKKKETDYKQKPSPTSWLLERF